VRERSFQFVRLMAATLVVYGHSFILTGDPHGPGWLGVGVEDFAVRIFFVVSGYLICLSWNADPNIANYLIKRCLRILPGLLVVVLLSAFVLGLSVTSLDASSYVRSMATSVSLECGSGTQV
jgi:peptidoglycan/LPS O-acetylase OafA/YrhL